MENEGDVMLRKAFTYLFSNHKTAVTIIKWKDVFTNLEQVLDECEKTADTVDEIIIKNF